MKKHCSIYKKRRRNELRTYFLFGTVAGACINKHPQRTNTTEYTKPLQRKKQERRLKYGDTRRLSVSAVFFYAAASYLLFVTLLKITFVYFPVHHYDRVIFHFGI